MVLLSHSIQQVPTEWQAPVIGYWMTSNLKGCSTKKPRQSFWIRQTIWWGKCSPEPNWSELRICAKSTTFSAYPTKDTNGLHTMLTHTFAFVGDFLRSWRMQDKVVFGWVFYEIVIASNWTGTLPGMWERTITIGSADKTFSVTGWYTDWLYGPVQLMSNLLMMHRNSHPAPIQVIPSHSDPITFFKLTFSIHWLQEAIAVAFETEMNRMDTDQCYFNLLPNELRAKRDYMTRFLNDIGMEVIVPQGGYFLLADWSPLGDFIMGIMIYTLFAFNLSFTWFREQSRPAQWYWWAERLSIHQVDD